MLTLTIEYYQYLPRKNWSDNEKYRLEDCLNSVIDHLKMAAAHSKVETEKRLLEEGQRLEEEEQRKILAKQRKRELEKLEILEKRGK